MEESFIKVDVYINNDPRQRITEAALQYTGKSDAGREKLFYSK
jgi:hypothetical protein